MQPYKYDINLDIGDLLIATNVTMETIVGYIIDRSVCYITIKWVFPETHGRYLSHIYTKQYTSREVIKSIQSKDWEHKER